MIADVSVMTEIFSPGSVWQWDEMWVVVGENNTDVIQHNRLFLYEPGKDLPAGYITIIGAINQIISGNLRPCVPDDLSFMSEQEQEYYRRA